MPNGRGTHGYANPESFDPNRKVQERPSKNEFKQQKPKNK